MNLLDPFNAPPPELTATEWTYYFWILVVSIIYCTTFLALAIRHVPRAKEAAYRTDAVIIDHSFIRPALVRWHVLLLGGLLVTFGIVSLFSAFLFVDFIGGFCLVFGMQCVSAYVRVEFSQKCEAPVTSHLG